jgi:hypothetical protein
VHLTVGSERGRPLSPTDPVIQSLTEALRGYQDPVHRVVVDSYEERWFGVDAALLIDPARRWDDIDAAARAALTAAFSVARRQFGQGVTPAEVLTVLQSVEGVRAVDLDRIFRVDAPAIAAPPRILIEARGPQTSGGGRQTAELLLVSPTASNILLRPMPA